MRTDAIRDFLEGRPAPAPGPEYPFDREELAAAALMVECARIDGAGMDEDERQAICRAVREEFSLDEETAECLVAVAERRHDEVWDDWLFTHTIKNGFDEREQLGVIRRLWEIAFADHLIHPHELHLISRIGRELGIEEQAIRESREWVRQRMGQGEG
jgi:uncharacterized tellurite resistance protein B-like protein